MCQMGDGERVRVNAITYPVPLGAYSAKEAPYVYTEKAEQVARRLGLENRKAGTIAMLGYEPLDAETGKEWEAMGFVRRRDA